MHEGDLARARLRQVFKFLAAFNELQNPVERDITNQLWSLNLSELPDHEAIVLRWPTLEDEDDQDLGLPGERSFSVFQLTVRRPNLSPCPPPPDCLGGWFASADWKDPDGSVKMLDVKTEPGPDGSDVSIRFSSDPARQSALEAWSLSRQRWAVKESPARAAMKVYEEFFRLQARLDREFEEAELILGDGMLVWDVSGGLVKHPVLLQRIKLEFDPSVPQFTLSEVDAGPELYAALLNKLFSAHAVGIQRCIAELEEKAWHPVGGEETDSFLKRLASQLGPNSEFVGERIPYPAQSSARIGRAPVVFLRKRTLGFNTAINEILRDLDSGDTALPEGITSIVGIGREEERPRGSCEEGFEVLATNGEDEDILLAKEANAEQLEIARRLRQYGAVLVQGPPGTGKTHTIANLIGHLLSEGKRVLVTSQTAKALKVLRDKVMRELQPLCVSLSHGDSKQLESAIDEITERLASWDAQSLFREASILEQRRLEVLRELRRAREEFLRAQLSEYTPIVVAGRSYSPSEAGRFVAEKRGSCSWLPGPVRTGSPLPLSETEVRELYSTNDVTPEEEQEILSGLPDVQDIPSPSDFEQFCLVHGGLTAERISLRPDLWGEASTSVTPDLLGELLARSLQAVDSLQIGDQWYMMAVQDGRGEGRVVWQELIKAIDEAVGQSRIAHAEGLKHDLVLPISGDPTAVCQALEEIRVHLEQGRSLSLWLLATKPTWSKVLKASKVDGRRPASREDVDALLSRARLVQMRAQLRARWERQMASFGVPKLGDQPETEARVYAESLRRAIDWFAGVWTPIEQGLKMCGFNWEGFLAETPLEPVEYADVLRIWSAVHTRLQEIIRAQADRLALESLNERLGVLTRVLERIDTQDAASATASLLGAVKGRNPEEYRLAHGRLVVLRAAAERLERRYCLVNRLETAAPTWADEIRNRKGAHAKAVPPGDIAKAWMWRQLEQELAARAGVSLSALQDRAAMLSQTLRKITVSLIERRAWAAQIKATSLPQRQALNGWKQLVMKAGKRKGKRAPRLLAEARRLMPICQTAVPVWIMPLNLMVESFSPKRNRFDVVIIDEASQANILALAALYLGNQVIVVGDHEQVSPEAVGQRVSDIQGLIDMLLRDVPNSNLYDGQTSIYHLAQTSFGGAVMLREHFRCVPAIIQFSNLLSYQGKIRPLRDDSGVQVKPPTAAYRVQGTLSDLVDRKGKTNPLEARTIAALLLSASEQPEYSGKSFGVISLVGTEQAMLIDSFLQRYMDPGEYIRRRVLCGNPAQFQGDERDVVFLSMVDAPRGDGPLPYRPDPGDRFKKRFNVAASRPRDQLWVVHSVDPDIDLKPDDLRRRLILHARNPYAVTSEIAAQADNTESEFERLVLSGLVRAGYRVTPQWPVGAYRMDLVVEGGGKRLAIECDGDRYHTPDHLAADMGRQLILERLGWTFLRIRGSQFFRDPEGTLAEVAKRLTDLGITADGQREGQEPATVTEPVYERVTRRAAEYLAEWNDQGGWSWDWPPRRTSGGELHSGMRSVMPTMLKPAARTPDAPYTVPSHSGIEPQNADSPLPAGTGTRRPLPIIGKTCVTPCIAPDHRPQAAQASPSNVQQESPVVGPSPLAPMGLRFHVPIAKPRESEADGAEDPLMIAIRREGLEAVDKRAKGGALWIIGGLELKDKIKKLADQGYLFTYSPNGGRATQHQPAWWTSGVAKNRK